MEIRDRTITIRMSEKEIRELEEIKNEHSITSSGHMIRVLMQWYKIKKRLNNANKKRRDDTKTE